MRIGEPHPGWLGIGEIGKERLGGHVYMLFVPSRSVIARVWTEGMITRKYGWGELVLPPLNGTGDRNAHVE